MTAKGLARREAREPAEDRGSHRRFRAMLGVGVCVLLALALFYVGISEIRYRPSTQQHLAAAEATVVKSGQRRFSPRSEGSYVELRFVLPDGRAVTADLNRVELEPGTKVPVRYDPKEPRHVVIDDDRRAWLHAAGAIAFGILLLGAAWFVPRFLKVKLCNS